MHRFGLLQALVVARELAQFIVKSSDGLPGGKPLLCPHTSQAFGIGFVVLAVLAQRLHVPLGFSG